MSARENRDQTSPRVLTVRTGVIVAPIGIGVVKGVRVGDVGPVIAVGPEVALF